MSFQPCFGKGFFQFGEGFLFPCLGRGNLSRRSLLLFLFREQVEVVLRVFRFIFLLLLAGFVPVDVVHCGVVLYLAPRFCHILVLAAYAVVLELCSRQFRIQKFRCLHRLVLYLQGFRVEQVEDEIGRAEQGEVEDGRKHVLRLSPVDFLQ